jgi:hypothetical protein
LSTRLGEKKLSQQTVQHRRWQLEGGRES